ncbi:hypothetical protein CK203_103677 [Vitis vinifera]|uniref:Uncharacterized protein n=1 Tax=Vitis vinifera TaxID=29760 RepID=A0A438DNE7_VITVI|nr:hypothetical protein CK203_103677 [Vitis vinifera]
MENEDSHGNAKYDFVFDDDNLTWGDVARAAGVEEAREMVDSANEEDEEGYECDDGNDDDDFVDLEDE